MGRFFVIPTEAEESRGTMGRFFVIPTEVEGSHGTPSEAIVKMTRLRIDLIEMAAPMFSELSLRTRFAKLESFSNDLPAHLDGCGSIRCVPVRSDPVRKVLPDGCASHDEPGSGILFSDGLDDLFHFPDR